MTFASWAFHNPISFDKTRKRVEVAMNRLVLGVQSKTRPFSLVSRSTRGLCNVSFSGLNSVRTIELRDILL